MNAILGYAQILLRDKELPDRVTRAVDTIQRSGDHLLKLINDVLDISKIEAGRLELQPSDFDLQGMIQNLSLMTSIRSVSETVMGEISRSLDFFTATAAESRISRVLLSGGGASISGFAEAFQERTSLNVEVLNPLNRMLPNTSFDQDYLDEVAPSLGVAVGLAARRIDA